MIFATPSLNQKNYCCNNFKLLYFSAEMIGFKNLDPFYNILPMIPGVQFFTNNSKLDSISKIQRGQYVDTGAITADYELVTFYEPVPLEFYIKFSFFSYFMTFFGILFLQSFTICIIDIFWLKTITSNITIWERILHAIQKSHFPFPHKNWHEGNGSCLNHEKRKKLVQKEVLTATIVNLVFNMVMLIPLVILCKIKKYS